MKIVLSPAKSLDFENIPESKVASQPIFLDESQLLINKLKKYSPKKLGLGDDGCVYSMGLDYRDL